MRAKRWFVGKLEEFYPNPGLLGLNKNRGQVVSIKTRNCHDKSQLHQFEFVLGTLLHELVHIVHSNHSAEFYDELNKLKEEALTIRFRRDHVLPQLNRVNRGNAAQAQVQVIQGQGRKLGGRMVFGQKRETIAKAVLARHREEDLKCGGSSDKVVWVLPQTARAIQRNPVVVDLVDSDEDMMVVAMPASCADLEPIVLDQDDDGDDEVIMWGESQDSTGNDNTACGTQLGESVMFVPWTTVKEDENSAGAATASRKENRSNDTNTKRMEIKPVKSSSMGWLCEKCTLVNVDMYLQCAACGFIQNSKS